MQALLRRLFLGMTVAGISGGCALAALSVGRTSAPAGCYPGAPIVRDESPRKVWVIHGYVRRTRA